MASLAKSLRKQLESTVRQARDIAEAGARDALMALGVGDAKVASHLSEEDRELRRRLRAHGRQLGDRLGSDDSQETMRLAHEVAYEHWHRILFARFLAENDLLIHPDHGVALSIEECEELARSKAVDPWELAGSFAEKILPAVFRSDDPVLKVALPPETKVKLASFVQQLPKEVFLADDSLGWVYQFWQAKRKDEVNASGKKIGADEISPVTQLFTEDYMVEFLLHNTLGAWWAGKVIDDRTAQTFSNEEEARAAAKLGQIDWKYLRFVKDEASGKWRPAAGVFEGWPKKASEVTVLDPCMGSGHSLVFALPILVEMRRHEEGLDLGAAIERVLAENIFGLEIDPRCTQIAAFNLAFAAWKLGGYRKLPQMNLACSGLGINATKDEWQKLAGDDKNLRIAMGQIHELFANAPVLGSLIDPKQSPLVKARVVMIDELSRLLRGALAFEDLEKELAVQALGIASAAEILSGQFTLVATNVPYLGRGKQDDALKDYSERVYPRSKADLATCFIERSLEFCATNGSIALVTPQNWLFLATFQPLRMKLLEAERWNYVARLGAKGFQTPMWDFNVMLLGISRSSPRPGATFLGIDASSPKAPDEKVAELLSGRAWIVPQAIQLKNPSTAVVFEPSFGQGLLSSFVTVHYGSKPGQTVRVTCPFWETDRIVPSLWIPMESTPSGNGGYSGKAEICYSLERIESEGIDEFGIRGADAWKKKGFVLSKMASLPMSIYCGQFFDDNTYVVIPRSEEHHRAIYTFLSSEQYRNEVRKRNQKLAIDTEAMITVPFDLAYWQKVAEERWPHGLPRPFSSDPTQWLFNGHPAGADQPLHVAVARLLGYQWPRQTGSSFQDCPALEPDELENLADDDGIVCLHSVRGEDPAASCLRELLAIAFGSGWKVGIEQDLLRATGSSSENLEEWLLNDFFEQHCTVFHHRPFIWHIWDGRKDGFGALVNYHKLAAPNGEGRKLLESLTYSYLGDWVSRQQDGKRRSEEGSEDRLAAALELKGELEKILKGEPPYDIFVRWKPIHEQPIGWEPDINDGVRVNIRPFMNATLSRGKKGAGILRAKPNIKWQKDRGNEPVREKADFPWFWGWDENTRDFTGGDEFDGNRWNDLHYSTEFKRKARESRK